MKIIDAGVEDADLIADAIMEAVGPEICRGIAGKDGTRQDVHELFAALARREDSQYGYRNARVAVMDDDPVRMGVCVSYDGADLRRLRRSFFEEANARFGWGMTAEAVERLPEEAGADEYYLDTLAVLPQYRGEGVGTALIRDAKARAEKSGKPLGLLVDEENENAARLYESLGFREVCRRPFAGVEMRSMRL